MHCSMPHTGLLWLCLWLGVSCAAGKCAGKWAIHACGGGNGKRSDPRFQPLELDSPNFMENTARELTANSPYENSPPSLRDILRRVQSLQGVDTPEWRGNVPELSPVSADEIGGAGIIEARNPYLMGGDLQADSGIRDVLEERDNLDQRKMQQKLRSLYKKMHAEEWKIRRSRG